MNLSQVLINFSISLIKHIKKLHNIFQFPPITSFSGTILYFFCCCKLHFKCFSIYSFISYELALQHHLVNYIDATNDATVTKTGLGHPDYQHHLRLL